MTNPAGPDFQSTPQGDPNPYANPYQAQHPAPSPYGQAPYQQPQPQRQASYQQGPQAPYQQQAPYPQATYLQGQPQGRPALAPRSGALGIVTLVLTMLATGGGLIAAARCAAAYSNLFLEYGLDVAYVPADDPMLVSAGLWLLLYVICGIFWLVTLILSIVAIATNRGRPWAVIALVLTISGAVVSGILFGAVLGNGLGA